MDFRQYDPSTGRFYNIDLLAEQAYNMTPYRFGFNNPILFSDPSGLKELYQGGDMMEIVSLMWDATPENGSTFWQNNSAPGGSLIFDGAITNFGDWGSGGAGVGYEGNYAGTIGSSGFFMESGMVGGFVLENFVAIVNSQGQIQNGQALLNHVQNGISNAFNNSGNNLQTAGYFDGTGNMTTAQKINTVIGAVGLFMSGTENFLRSERKALLRSGTDYALRTVRRSIDPSLSKISKWSKRLGVLGALTTIGTVGKEYFVDKKDLTYGQVADIAISVTLAAITISNPVALIGFGIYGILDASGSLDTIKKSLGGDNVLIHNNR